MQANLTITGLLSEAAIYQFEKSSRTVLLYLDFFSNTLNKRLTAANILIPVIYDRKL